YLTVHQTAAAGAPRGAGQFVTTHAANARLAACALFPVKNATGRQLLKMGETALAKGRDRNAAWMLAAGCNLAAVSSTVIYGSSQENCNTNPTRKRGWNITNYADSGPR